MSRSAEDLRPDSKELEEVEEPTRGDAPDAASAEPAPLTERLWRHPWSHRDVETVIDREG